MMQIRTVTDGERAQMRGNGFLWISVSSNKLHHDFWLADIQDVCMIGLDLLDHWGAIMDVPGACLYLGSHTIAPQCCHSGGANHS